MDNKFTSYYGDVSQNNFMLTELFSGDLRQEITSDSIIPDTVSDVEKVLLCTAVPRIDGYYVGENTLEIEGSVTYSSLLLTEGSELISLTFTEPFEIRQECRMPSQDCRVILVPCIENATARLVNPRKLNLRSQVMIGARILCPVSLLPTVSGTESLDDDMNLQRSFLSVTSAEIETIEEKDIAVSYDMELDSNDPPAAEILLCRVALHPSEVKIRETEADVRTDACASLIYRTEQGNCFTAEKKFSLEKTIALPSSGNWECIATAMPGEVSAQIAANAYGEMKVVELDLHYDLALTAIRNAGAVAVSDMYSVEFECETSFRTLPVMRLHRVYNTGLSLNASASREELGAIEARNVFAGAVTLRDRTVSFREEKNKMVAEGTADITLVCENNAVEGSEPPYSTYSFSYPFRCEMDAGEAVSSADLLPDCRIVGTKYRIDSGNLYADLELSIRVMALAEEPITYLESIHLDHTAPVLRSSAPITLCYPSGKESLWDIAKYYKITQESIMASNGLADSDIAGKKVLLIPHSQPKKPVFSKVI